MTLSTEDDEDILDWDRLTDDAEDEASEDEDEFDDDLE